MSQEEDVRQGADEREALCLSQAKTIREHPQFVEILENLAVFAEKMEAEGIPAWMVQGVLNDEIRNSRFYEMAVQSLNRP